MPRHHCMQYTAAGTTADSAGAGAAVTRLITLRFKVDYDALSANASTYAAFQADVVAIVAASLHVAPVNVTARFYRGSAITMADVRAIFPDNVTDTAADSTTDAFVQWADSFFPPKEFKGVYGVGGVVDGVKLEAFATTVAAPGAAGYWDVTNIASGINGEGANHDWYRSRSW